MYAQTLRLQFTVRFRSELFSVRANMRPEIIAKPTPFNRTVLKKCKMLEQEYKKPTFLFNAHAETLWGSFLRSHLNLNLERKYLSTGDGGVISLDSLKGIKLSDEAPIVIFIAGLAGGSNCSYVQYSIQSAHAAGFRPIGFNSRGTADTPVYTGQFYSASYTEDLRLAVSHIQKSFPKARIFAAGWSLGANILVNFLAEEGGRSAITAAASLCNPFDCSECDQNLKRGIMGPLYDRHLAASMQTLLQKYESQFAAYDMEKAMTATTVRGVDDAVTRVTFGWESVDEYYRGSSSAIQIDRIRIPLLCVQAADDPIALEKSIPKKAILENEHCALVVTPYGGHLGWITTQTGLFGPPWTTHLVTDWFLAVLHEMNGGKLTE